MPRHRREGGGGVRAGKRPGQPVELSPVYVMLASEEVSYVSGTTVAVTGGKPMI
ncbi:hypothetical protein [Methylobacterium aquaticum]|uniref:hypothetical protein n=1 Tax=Methylobacterium aquaticum TaxID=270351 RepID=UPI003D7C2BF7